MEPLQPAGIRTLSMRWITAAASVVLALSPHTPHLMLHMAGFSAGGKVTFKMAHGARSLAAGRRFAQVLYGNFSTEFVYVCIYTYIYVYM